MRIVTNELLVKRNKQIATYLFFFSLGILILGFFMANGQLLGIVDEEINRTLYLVGMPIILLIGFATTMISVRMTNLWVRVPRPEDAIQDGLKGISNKSAIYHYFHLPARHVLICPYGIFAIINRFQDGEIIHADGKWRQKRGPVSQLFSLFRLDGVGNPTAEAEAAADHIRYLIEDYDPDIPVYPVIIFHDPRTRLNIEDPQVPVLYTDPKREPNLKDYIRSKEKVEQFDNNEKLTEFIEAFEEFTI